MANGNGGDPRDAQDHDPKTGEITTPMPSAMTEPTLAVDLQMAEMDRLIATAHKYPRNLRTFQEQLAWMSCNNEAAAENCVYALPRAGKAIVGASIGFANLAATCWGNIWDTGRWIYTDRKEKVVIAEGVCIDWQTNRRVAMTEQRRIVDRGGRLFSDDMIIVTSKAAAAIGRRNAILQIIPRPLWYPTYEKALYIVRGSEATLVERREKAVKALAAFGVDPKRVFMYLGVQKIEEIGVEHMPTLRGMFTQLKDGSVTVEDMFDPRRMTAAVHDPVANPLADDDEVEAGKDAAAATSEKQATTTTAELQNAASGQQEAKGEADAAPGAEEGGAPKTEQAAQDSQAQADPKPSGAKKSGGGKKAAAAAEPAKAEPAAEQANVKMPVTAAEYLDYSIGPQGWVTLAVKGAASPEALDNRRKSPAEREMRKLCGVMEDDLIAFQGAFQKKMGELA